MRSYGVAAAAAVFALTVLVTALPATSTWFAAGRGADTAPGPSADPGASTWMVVSSAGSGTATPTASPASSGTATPAPSAGSGAGTRAVVPSADPAPRPPAVPGVPAVPGRRSPVRIMPLGDSITAGSGSSGTGGYRTPLGRSLRAAGIPFDFVGSLRNGRGADRDHEGHRGWRTDQLQANIDAWLAAGRPDVVLLDIGTNDVWQNATPRRAPDRLSALIDTILAWSPRVHVVVAKIGVAGGTGRARLAAGQREFNRSVPGIVAAKGQRVSMVDMTRVPWTNTTDGVHPDILGYRQMAYQWYQALRRLPLPGAAAAPDIADPFPRARARGR